MLLLGSVASFMVGKLTRFIKLCSDQQRVGVGGGCDGGGKLLKLFHIFCKLCLVGIEFELIITGVDLDFIKVIESQL